MKTGVLVIPTYNEKKNIRALIPAIMVEIKKISGWKLRVLVVDDTSPDGTYDEVIKLQKKYSNLHVIQGKKEGLGKAYVRGFSHAINKFSPDVLVEMDADGQHPPSLLPLFFKKIDDGADLVVGSRYIKGGSIPANWELYRKFFSYFGNNLVLRFGFMEFGVTDWTSGFRVIKTDFIKKTINYYKKLDGYTFQIGMIDKALKNHLKITEIPLVFEERTEGESKIETFKFVFDNIIYILLNSTFIKFSIVGLLGFLVDFGFAAIFIGVFSLFKPHANAISAEIAIIFNFLVNNFWSFNHKKISSGGSSYISKFIKFNVVASGSIVIQWVGMYVALGLLGDTVLKVFSINIETWIIYKVFIIALLIIPYSYFMYNKFIWKDPTKA